MDLFEKAKEFGKLIQQDQRFKDFQEALKVSEGNKELQDMIGQFNLKLMNLKNENGKKEKDNEKIKQLDKELSSLHHDILKNELMINFENKTKELEKLVNGICKIIVESSKGQDPDKIEIDSCSGDCSTCGGCH